jgi:hypothetical protein
MRRQSYSEKWEYVLQDRVRAGLVGRAEDCPSLERCTSSAGDSRVRHPLEGRALPVHLWCANQPDDTAVVPQLRQTRLLIS